MATGRTVVLALVCLTALAGTFLFFGSDPAPVAGDVHPLVGSWTGPRATLELGGDGRYALILGTAGAAVECGKWRVEEGSLQMRARSGAPRSRPLSLTQPGLRAGAVHLDPGPPERLALRLREARPGAASRESAWELARPASAAGLLARCR